VIYEEKTLLYWLRTRRNTKRVRACTDFVFIDLGTSKTSDAIKLKGLLLKNFLFHFQANAEHIIAEWLEFHHALVNMDYKGVDKDFSLLVNISRQLFALFNLRNNATQDKTKAKNHFQ
jgi:hypothetical protein